MRFGDHMCVILFGGGKSSRRDGPKTPVLEKKITVDDDFLKRALPPAAPKSPKNGGERSKDSKVAAGNNKKRKSSTTSPEDRITFSRLIAILREAYITTMNSFATKPGGLGGMAMGGKIDLPDATPSRTFREPRDFVRSWSKGRADYIQSPLPHYAVKAQSGIAVK